MFPVIAQLSTFLFLFRSVDADACGVEKAFQSGQVSSDGRQMDRTQTVLVSDTVYISCWDYLKRVRNQVFSP